MDDLRTALPSLEQVVPLIAHDQSYFNNSYRALGFLNKVKLANDIVRSSMIFTALPKEDSLTTFVGDCLTACRLCRDYLIGLVPTATIKICFVRRRKHDPLDRYSTKHFVLLVEYKKSIMLSDPTPTKGFGLGKVCNIDDETFYRRVDLVESSEEDLLVVEYIYKLWRALLEKSKEVLTLEEYLVDNVEVLAARKHLHSWLSEAFYQLALYYQREDIGRFSHYIDFCIRFDPYKLKLLNLTQLSSSQRLKVESCRKVFQLSVDRAVIDWQKQLKALKRSSKLETSLDLLSNIFLESAMARGETIGPIFKVRDIELRGSDITPRLLAEFRLCALVVDDGTLALIKRVYPALPYWSTAGNNYLHDWLPKSTYMAIHDNPKLCKVVLVDDTIANYYRSAKAYVSNSPIESLLLIMLSSPELCQFSRWGYTNPLVKY